MDPTAWVASLGYGRWSLKLYGYALLIVVTGLLIAATNVYQARVVREAVETFRLHNSAEHRAQAEEDRRTRCVLALSAEQRQTLLADRYPGAWLRACWWMDHPQQ